jgi:hypothetical protein
MVSAGYMSSVALVPVAKWLWFIFALILFVFVVLGILREFRQTIIDKNDVMRIELYSRVSLLVLIVWAIYPLVWLLGVGFGALGVSLEVRICVAVSGLHVLYLACVRACVCMFVFMSVSVCVRVYVCLCL